MTQTFDFAAELAPMIRRLLRIQSPMNVWKKQFTCLSMVHEMVIALEREYREFETISPVGSVTKVRIPQRYEVKHDAAKPI